MLSAVTVTHIVHLTIVVDAVDVATAVVTFVVVFAELEVAIM